MKRRGPGVCSSLLAFSFVLLAANSFLRAPLPGGSVINREICEEELSQSAAAAVGIWPTPAQICASPTQGVWVPMNPASPVEFPPGEEGQVLRESFSLLWPGFVAESKCSSVARLKLQVVNKTVLNPHDVLEDTSLERYELSITPDSVTMRGETVFGVLHALKALHSLAVTSPDGCMRVPACVVRDVPAHSWRGFSLDTAHVKIEVPQLKRLILFLSLNRMNVFHWHLSDTQSFGLMVNGAPRLANPHPNAVACRLKMVIEPGLTMLFRIWVMLKALITMTVMA